MSDQAVDPTTGAPVPPATGGETPGETPAAPAPTPPPAAPPLFVAHSQEELNAKFGATRDEGRLSLAKSYGYETVAEMDEAMKAHQANIEKDKTEAQKAKEDAAAAKKAQATAAARLAAVTLEREAEKQALAAGADPTKVADVIRLRDAADGEVDAQGNPVAAPILASVTAVLTKHPSFKAAAPTVGEPTNPPQADAKSIDKKIEEANKANNMAEVVRLQMSKFGQMFTAGAAASAAQPKDS